METKEIIQIISNFGFPVLMCLLLFYYIRNEQKKTNETLQELRLAIDRNTTIIELFIKESHVSKIDKGNHFNIHSIEPY